MIHIWPSPVAVSALCLFVWCVCPRHENLITTLAFQFTHPLAYCVSYAVLKHSETQGGGWRCSSADNMLASCVQGTGSIRTTLTRERHETQTKTERQRTARYKLSSLSPTSHSSPAALVSFHVSKDALSISKHQEEVQVGVIARRQKSPRHRCLLALICM